MKLNVVNNSIKVATQSANYGGGNQSQGNYGGASSQSVGTSASSSIAGNTGNFSSSPSISDQITSASVQTNNLLSMSQNLGGSSGDSQVGSVTTNLIPLPSVGGGQVVMAEVQITNLQGDISSATSGVVSASEADEIASQIICLLYTSPSPRDGLLSRMPSSA